MAIKQMRYKKTYFRKIISGIIISVFLFNNPSQAILSDALKPSNTNYQDATNLPVSSQIVVPDPESIIIGDNIGNIKEVFKGENSKLIVNIQDAHCNFEAQTNISNILAVLGSKYGVKFVALEGSTGEIDPSIFTTFPDEDVRKEVAEYFMKNGKINGAEYLAITSKNPPQLYGVETKEYYLANLAAFTNTLQGKKETTVACIKLKQTLDKLKDHIYTKELKVFDAKLNDYKEEKLGLVDFCKYLKEVAESQRIQLDTKFPNLCLLYRTIDIEKRIDFNKVEQERAKVITVLENALSQKDLERLFLKSVNFKSDQISASKYHLYLKGLIQAYQIDLNLYPNLALYIDYLNIYEKVDSYTIFKEIASLENEIKEKLFRNEDQRVLDKLSKNIRLIGSMLDISMSKEDVEYYNMNKNDFRSSTFIDFIKRQAKRYKISFNYDPNFALIDRYLPDLENFYRIADKRDEAIVENTLNKMQENNLNIVALITGGYHTEGVTQRLRDRGISYVVISPRITKPDSENPYLELLTNEGAPVVEGYSGGTGRLALNSMNEITPMVPNEEGGAREVIKQALHLTLVRSLRTIRAQAARDGEEIGRDELSNKAEVLLRQNTQLWLTRYSEKRGAQPIPAATVERLMHECQATDFIGACVAEVLSEEMVLLKKPAERFPQEQAGVTAPEEELPSILVPFDGAVAEHDIITTPAFVKDSWTITGFTFRSSSGKPLSVALNSDIVAQPSEIETCIEIYKNRKSLKAGEVGYENKLRIVNVLDGLVAKGAKGLIHELNKGNPNVNMILAAMSIVLNAPLPMFCAHRGDFISKQPIAEPDVEFGELGKALGDVSAHKLEEVVRGTICSDATVRPARKEGNSEFVPIVFRKSIDGRTKEPLIYEVEIDREGVPVAVWQVTFRADGSQQRVRHPRSDETAFCSAVSSWLKNYLDNRANYAKANRGYLDAQEAVKVPKKEEVEECKLALQRAVKRGAPAVEQEQLGEALRRAEARLNDTFAKAKEAGDKRKAAQKELVLAQNNSFKALHGLLTGTAGGVYRDSLLENYLGGDDLIQKYYKLFWSVKRFQNFIHVFKDPALQAQLKKISEDILKFVEGEERTFREIDQSICSANDLSMRYRRLIDLKNMSWFINQETLGTITKVKDLAGLEGMQDTAGIPAVAVNELYFANRALTSMERVLSSMDKRLETRGRDSLGFVTTLTFKDKGSYEAFMKVLKETSEGPADRERLENIRKRLEEKLRVTPAGPEQERIRNKIEKLQRTSNLHEEFLFRSAELRNLVNFSMRTSYREDQDSNAPVSVTFVYKIAERVGALGTNVAAIRSAIKGDHILRLILGLEEGTLTTYSLLAHTRWASCGIISEPNCHPAENRGIYAYSGKTGTYEEICNFDTGHAKYYGRNGIIFVVLNGDVNNYRTRIGEYPNLMEEYENAKGQFEKRWVSPEITYDTKMIPLRIEHYLQQGHELKKAIWLACRDFTGSFSIQITSDLEPGKMFVAQFGEGQELNLCISQDGIHPSSEAHGSIEETNEYIRLKPAPGEGVLAVWDPANPPLPEKIEWYPFSRDYKDMPEAKHFASANIERTPLTGRDTYLPPEYSHYLFKELNEGPDMLEATYLGKIGTEEWGRTPSPIVNLDEQTLPQDVIEKFKSGKIRRVVLTGMGTADTAGGAIAMIGRSYLNSLRAITGREINVEVVSELATNASAFDLRDDMTDTLIIAISQSGGTADTNTFLARATLETTLTSATGRGASLLGIINKRDSDGESMIRQAGGGVFYTGTGRDIEIAVASTKAFYAQIAAGTIFFMVLTKNLAEALAEEKPEADIVGEFNKILVRDIQTLTAIPDKMRRLLQGIRDNPDHPLRQAASYWPLHRTEWKIAGSGAAFYAAKEGRIKLGELDYRSFPFDVLRDDEPAAVLARSWVVVNLADVEGENKSYLKPSEERVSKLLGKGAAVTLVINEEDERFDTPEFAQYRDLDFNDRPPASVFKFLGNIKNSTLGTVDYVIKSKYGALNFDAYYHPHTANGPDIVNALSAQGIMGEAEARQLVCSLAFTDKIKGPALAAIVEKIKAIPQYRDLNFDANSDGATAAYLIHALYTQKGIGIAEAQKLLSSKRFDEAAPLTVIYVPKTSEPFATILNTVVNHSLGYYVAVAMNQRAEDISLAMSRPARAAEETAPKGEQSIAEKKFVEIKDGILSGRFNTGFSLEYSARFLILYMALNEHISLETAGRYLGKQYRTLEDVNNDYLSFAQKCRDKLRRGIDAVLHQAKFVTVGATRQSFELYIGRRIEEACEGAQHSLFKGVDSGILKGFFKDYSQNTKTQVYVAPISDGKSRVFVISENREGASTEMRDVIRQRGFNIAAEDELIIDVPSSNTIIKVFDIEASADNVRQNGLSIAIIRGMVSNKQKKLATGAVKYTGAMSAIPDSLDAMLSGRIEVVSDAGLTLRPEVKLGAGGLRKGLAQKIREKKIKRIIITGDGISNMAARSIKDTIEGYIDDTRNLLTREAAAKKQDLSAYDFSIEVTAALPSDASSFELAKGDMSDTLVIGIASPNTQNIDNINFMEAAKEKGSELLCIASKSEGCTNIRDFIKRQESGLFLIDDVDESFYNCLAAGSIYAMQIARLLATSISESAYTKGIELNIAERMDDILVDDIVEMRFGIPNHIRRFLSEKEKAKENHPIEQAASYWPHRKPDWKVLGTGPGHAAALYGQMKIASLCAKFAGHDQAENYKHVDTATESFVILDLANVRGLGDTFNLDIPTELEKWRAHESFVAIITTEGDHRFDDFGIAKFSATGDVIEPLSRYNIIYVPKTSQRFSPFLLAMANDVLIGRLGEKINDRADEAKGIIKYMYEKREKIEKETRWSVEECVSSAEFRKYLGRRLIRTWNELLNGLHNAHLTSEQAGQLAVLYMILKGDLPPEAARNYCSGGIKDYTSVEPGYRYTAVFNDFIKVLEDLEGYLRVTGPEITEGSRRAAFKKKVIQALNIAEAEGEVVVSDDPSQVQVLAVHSFLDQPQGKPGIVVVMPDRPGIGAVVLSTIAQHGINAATISAQPHEGVFVMRVALDATPDKAQSLVGEIKRQLELLQKGITELDLKQRLGIVSETENYYITQDGGKIGKEVDLKNLHPSCKISSGSMVVGKDTVIEEGVVISNHSYVKNAKIGVNSAVDASYLDDVVVEEGVKISTSVLSTIPEKAKWAYSEGSQYKVSCERTVVGWNVKISSQSEIINTYIGADSVITASVLLHNEIGAGNEITDAKVNLVHTEKQVKIKGPTEVSESWIGRGMEIIRPAYVEGIFPNKVLAADIDPDGRFFYTILDGIPNVTTIGAHAIFSGYAGTMIPPEDGYVTHITGKEKSEHGTPIVKPSCVIAPDTRFIGLSGHPDLANPEHVLSGNLTHAMPFSIIGFEGTEAWGQFLPGELRKGLSERQSIGVWAFTYSPDTIIRLMDNMAHKLNADELHVLDGFPETMLRTGKAIAVLKLQEVSKLLTKKPNDVKLKERQETLQDAIRQYEEHLAKISGNQGGAWEYKNGNFVSRWRYDIAQKQYFNDRIDLAKLSGNQASYKQVMEADILSATRLTFREEVQPVIKEAVLTVRTSQPRIEEGVQVDPSAFIGPGVVLSGNTKIGPNAVLWRTNVHNGIVQSGARLLNTIVEGESTPPSVIGEDARVSDSHISNSVLLKGVTAIYSLVEGSIINEGTELEPFAIVKNCGKDGISGIVGSVLIASNTTEGTTNHHMSSRVYRAQMPLISFTRAGNVYTIPNITNIGGGAVIGRPNAEKDVVLESAFVASNTVVEEGARVGFCSFVKNRVASDELLLPFTFKRDAGYQNDIIGGVLDDMPGMVFRHLLSKTMAKASEDQRPQVDYVIEAKIQEALMEVERMLKGEVPTKYTRDQLIDGAARFRKNLDGRWRMANGEFTMGRWHYVYDSQRDRMTYVWEAKLEPHTPAAVSETRLKEAAQIAEEAAMAI